MDASTIDTFVGDYWDRFAAYWNTIPSHVRIIIMFLITRIIARALTPKPPTKKGAVKEIASLAEYQSRIAHAGNGRQDHGRGLHRGVVRPYAIAPNSRI